LIIAYDAKGMRASGNFADSLDVIIGDTYAELWGDEYAEQLEYGRNSGGFPPLQDIENWIVEKGVFNDVLQEIKLSSLAYLIARKIAQQGWNRANYGGVGLISEVITEERLQMIIDMFGENEVVNFSSDLIDIFKELESGN
jgi:hypothetical protein